MPWFMAAVYDHFMHATEQACLGAWRRELLAQSHGQVLELGPGTGVNLRHYPAAVEHVTLAEPDAFMRRRLATAVAQQPRAGRFDIEESSAGALPYADDHFDTVVATLVLCSVPDLDAALGEIARVLRPEGQLLFLEHVGAPLGTSLRRWQARLEPLWRPLAGGCHLTRETLGAIEGAGMIPMYPRAEEMRPAVPWTRPTVRGRAVKPGASA